MAKADYPVGTKIRFRARVKVYEKTGTNGTNQVQEVDGDRSNHFIYLPSDVIPSATAGDEIDLDFEAVVKGEYEGSRLITTSVCDNSPEKYTHYLYLDSKSVTVVKDPPVKDKKDLSVGDRLRFKASVQVRDSVGDSSTRRVIEFAPGTATHFLSLGSDKVGGSSDPVTGDKIYVEFDVKITETPELRKDLTTQVQEIDGVYIHYLYLESESVTVLDGTEPPIAPKPEPKPQPKRRTTVAINGYDTSISSDDVRERISELEDMKVYVVVRDRDNEELQSFSSEDEATDYIDTEDLNPSRFTVREDTDPDVESELSGLRQLDSDGSDEIDDWSYGVTLIREDQINEDYARDRYEEIAPRGIDLSEPPFSFIDWDQYADLLKEDARYVRFDGENYYSL